MNTNQNSSGIQPVRVAVVGTGNMGLHHLRIYDELKNVELVGIFDHDQAKAQELASRFSTTALTSLEAVADCAQAVSICSPSTTHAEIGLQFLEHGVHCLIEKPLATTEVDCLELITRAESTECKLMVGHIERFNPVVLQLARIIESGVAVHAIEARRLSAASKRITDVDVVADLMIHDIDIILSLIKSPVADVIARGVSVDGTDSCDYVTALITFENGTLAPVTASRITQNKVRELNVTTEKGLIFIDYIMQNLLVYQQSQPFKERPSQRLGEYALDIAMERAFVRHEEPLQSELKHFIDSILRGYEPMVTANQALDAMRLVWRIQEIVRAKQK